jgi:uncharacterized protein (TIGR03083 family)
MHVDGPARKADIRQDLLDAQARLDAVLDRVGADGWSRPSPNEGWAVRELLAHLATAEAGFVTTFTRMAAGQGGVPDDFDIDRWNAGQLRRQTEASVQQLREKLSSAHQQMLALLDGLDDALLDRRGRMSIGIEGNVEDGFRLCARHKRGHTADIESALA